MRIVWASCDDTNAATPGWHRVREHQPHLFISQGDTPYTNAATNNLYGFGTMPAFTASTTEAQALDKLRQLWKKPTADALLLDLAARGAQAIYQPDDHEWADDNWDHTNAALGGSFTTQALVNTHWDRVNKALTTFMGERWNNPAPDAALNTQRPSGALGSGENPSASLYPIRYFVQDYDLLGSLIRTAVGPTVPADAGAAVRVVFLDCISYRSPNAATDNSSKVLLGAQQEAWLLAVLAASAAIPHVLISSTKKLWRGSGGVSDNSDTFGNFTTERQRILSAIQAMGVRPIWLSGDRHTLTVCETRVATGSVCDMIDITACPIGVEVNGVGPTYPELIWKTSVQGYGLVAVDQAGLTAELREANTGSVLWTARFAPYSNAPIYTNSVTAIRLG